MPPPLPPPKSTRQRVNLLLSKLSDRDTESLAADELSSLALSLPPHSLPPFISALADSHPSDKPPLRRHSLRLLSLLARSLPPPSLPPLLPRLLSASLRRLRDPDSSVRAALVDTIRSLAASAAASTPSILLRPLQDALFHEQDVNAQSVAALSLSAALEECADGEELGLFLQRLVPRLVKLARNPAFKAKAPVLGLVGSVSFSGSGVGVFEMKMLVCCLVEFLGSLEWAARNAAAVALARLAVVKKEQLCGFRDSCVAAFEARRYDKVKIVRDSMNRMLEVWKEIPEKEMDESKSCFYPKENGSDRRQLNSSIICSSSVQCSSPFTAKKMRISTCKSPPDAVTPSVAAKNNEIDQRKSSRMINQRKISDCGVEIAVPDASMYKEGNENWQTSKGSGIKSYKQESSENNGRSRLEVKRALFEKNWEDKKIGDLKSGYRIVPFEEAGSSEIVNETTVVSDKFHGGQKDGDFSLIRMQLVQIENQQSSLLNLLQKFIGSSQKGIHSLEERVLKLEITLENMSRDIASASSSERAANGRDGAAKLCCRLPVTEFLSSKFWRRAEGRYRYTSGLLCYRQESERLSLNEGFINPLAEVNPQALISRSCYGGTTKVV